VNLMMKYAFLVLIFLVPAQGQKVGPSREQCREEAAQWAVRVVNRLMSQVCHLKN
jgi:hypothetical protein